MPDFGSYLLDHGIVSAEALDQAAQGTIAFGGRLGTNLVEVGALGLDELGEQLSAHLGVPLPPEEWLKNPHLEALKALLPKLVTARKVLPLAIDAATLHVAMLDPRDESLVREIAATAKRRVAVYVLPEVVLLEHLERRFGLRRDPRYVSLARRRRAGAESAPRAASPAESEAEAAIGRLAEGEELIDESAFSELQARIVQRYDESAAPPTADDTAPMAESDVLPAREGRPAARPPKPREELLLDEVAPDARELASDARRSPAEIATLEARIAGAGDRDEVIALALELARVHARVAAFFVVHRGMVMGATASGDDLAARISGVVFPAGTPGVFTRPLDDGLAHRGTPPQQGIDARVLRALGRSEAQEIAVLPVTIRDRVVNLLYVDNGPDALPETSLAALVALCRCVTRAYERLILETKRARG